MYEFIKFFNNQLGLLYQDEKFLYMYLISSGRLQRHSIVFDDIKDDLEIYNLDAIYVSYTSLSDEFILARLDGDRFIEIYKNSLGASVTYHKFVCIKNSVAMIYVANENNKYNIYLSNNITVGKSTLLLSDISYINSIDILSSGNSLVILLNDILYKIGSNCAIEKYISNIDFLNKKTALNKQLNDASKQFENLNITISNQKSDIASLEQKNQEITEMYNDLAEYAGKLQDELRKYRYM